jgi:hypothetical protein
MSRTVVALMVRTGIPFSAWINEPDGVIDTALELLNEQSDRGDRSPARFDGRRMSG